MYVIPHNVWKAFLRIQKPDDGIGLVEAKYVVRAYGCIKYSNKLQGFPHKTC